MAQEIKLLSAVAEKRAIKALCGNDQVAAIVSGTVTADYFITEAGQAAYSRIRTLQEKRQITPKFADLLEDGGLPSTVKGALKADKLKPVTSKEDAEALLQVLNSYRQKRALKDLAGDIYASTGDVTKEPYDIISSAANQLAAINSGVNEFKVTTIGGKDANARKMVKGILKGTSKRYIPTGIKTFDDRNHGFGHGSLVLLASTTGGGKSALLNTLTNNMAVWGAKIAIVPLEMENEDLLTRTISDLSQYTMTKFLDPANRLTKAEKKKALAEYDAFEAKITKSNGRVHMIQPEEDVDIETLFMYIKPMDIDVVVIDYVGLLKGADSDDQAKALSRIGRYAKRWASINGKVVILAAQLSEDGLVRYSRALAEHASNLWQWVYTPYARENKVITIAQPKARQQDPFSFSLFYDPATMTIRDLTAKELKGFKPDTSSAAKGGDNKYGKGKGTAAKGKDYFADI